MEVKFLYWNLFHGMPSSNSISLNTYLCCMIKAVPCYFSTCKFSPNKQYIIFALRHGSFMDFYFIFAQQSSDGL